MKPNEEGGAYSTGCWASGSFVSSGWDGVDAAFMKPKEDVCSTGGVYSTGSSVFSSVCCGGWFINPKLDGAGVSSFLSSYCSGC